MFPLRKLGELSPRTRMRKIARILHAMEVGILHGQGFDAGYLTGLLEFLGKDLTAASRGAGGAISAREAEEITRAADSTARALAAGPLPSAALRGVNALRNSLLRAMAEEPSEWDLLAPETGALDRSLVSTHPIAAYLEDIRSPFNVGSLFRTAEAFGMERVYLSPRTPLPTHPRARKTARGAAEALPWEVRELSEIPVAQGVFALELGGLPLERFSFPDRGIVLVGSEELGLSPEALALADASLGRVSIPLAGAKRSLNVAVAFGVLLSRWHSALSAGGGRGMRPGSGGDAGPCGLPVGSSPDSFA
jgi:TrmH family RNA methyltransferase